MHCISVPIRNAVTNEIYYYVDFYGMSLQSLAEIDLEERTMKAMEERGLREGFYFKPTEIPVPISMRRPLAA